MRLNSPWILKPICFSLRVLACVLRLQSHLKSRPEKCSSAGIGLPTGEGLGERHHELLRALRVKLLFALEHRARHAHRGFLTAPCRQQAFSRKEPVLFGPVSQG